MHLGREWAEKIGEGKGKREMEGQHTIGRLDVICRCHMQTMDLEWGVRDMHLDRPLIE